MSHLHFPDGILAPWLLTSGWLLLAGLLWCALRRLERPEHLKRFPILGTLGALMLLGMSFEVVPIAYHVNISVIAGALLGPWLSIPAAFTVNLVLALLGHGGITVVGVNSLILSFEMIVGWAMVSFLLHFLREHPFFSGFASVFVALPLSTVLAINIVRLGVSDVGFFDAVRFAEISLALGAVGWLLEAWITGAILSSFMRLKPELFQRV